MRIVNQKLTVTSVVFSRTAGVVYFLMLCFFVYKSLMLLPIWLTTKTNAEDAMAEYQKKIDLYERKQDEIASKETDLGKERYQKDFFNKLDDGEKMIVLYKDKKEEESLNLEERKMFWWEEVKQDFLVWWRNL